MISSTLTSKIASLDLPNIDGINKFCEGVKDLGKDGMEAIKTIGQFFYYLMHPKQIFLWFWNCIDIYSFWICLFTAMICTVLYTLGFKKCGKYVSGSIAIYVLIKMISTTVC